MKPNVYLAPHLTLDLPVLYNNQVHILKATVPSFAKTLNYVALNHRPNTSYRNNRETGFPPRGHPGVPRGHLLHPVDALLHPEDTLLLPENTLLHPEDNCCTTGSAHIPLPPPYHTYVQTVSRASPDLTPGGAPPSDLSMQDAPQALLLQA